MPESVLPAATNPGTTYAVQVEDAWARLKRSRIRPPARAMNLRASSAGHPCDRFLYYERTENERRAPPSEERQAIFDLGNEVENYVLRELELAGVGVVERGRPFADSRLQLSGRIDASLRLPGWPRALPAEIKGLNPYTAGKVLTLADIRDSRTYWLRGYYAQQQAYLYLSSEELGLFVLFDKSRGSIRVLECPLDYDYAEGLLLKAERVRDAVALGEAPERVRDPAPCERCDFAHVCLPPRTYAGVRLLSDEDAAEVSALLERRAATEAAAGEHEEVDEALKGLLPESEGVLLVPGWEVDTRFVPRKGYSPKPVPPGGYYARRYKRLAGGQS
jgi:hypothetical protein